MHELSNDEMPSAYKPVICGGEAGTIAQLAFFGGRQHSKTQQNKERFEAEKKKAQYNYQFKLEIGKGLSEQLIKINPFDQEPIKSPVHDAKDVLSNADVVAIQAKLQELKKKFPHMKPARLVRKAAEFYNIKLV